MVDVSHDGDDGGPGFHVIPVEPGSLDDGAGSVGTFVFSVVFACHGENHVIGVLKNLQALFVHRAVRRDHQAGGDKALHRFRRGDADQLGNRLDGRSL